MLLTLGLLLLVQQIRVVSHGTTDFCQDYQSAERLLHGVSPYLPLHCWRGIVPVPAPLEYDSHPPFAALVFLPFGFLPLMSATLLWGLGCLAAYLATGVLLLRALGWRLLRGMALFVLLSLFWQPFTFAMRELNLGQLLTCLLAAAWWLERKHPRWAGGLLGLATLLKLWPALLILLALYWRRGRLALGAVATVSGGSLLTLVVLGLGASTAYLGPVRANEDYYVPSGGNLSLVAAVARPLGGYQAPSVLLPALVPGVSRPTALWLAEGVAGLVLLSLLLLLAWAGWRRPGERVEQISQSLLITTSLLVFPLTWFWGLVTLLVPGAILLLVLRQAPRPPRWWWGLMGAGLLLLLEPGWWLALPNWLLGQSAPGLTGLGVLLFGLPTFGLLLFAGGQAWLLWRVTTQATAGVSADERPVPSLR